MAVASSPTLSVRRPGPVENHADPIAADRAREQEALTIPRHGERLADRGITHGEQSLCRQWRQPSVLILDEPSAGLSPKIVAEVFSRLKAINQAGVTIILVEQNVKAALAIADRAVILVEGLVRHEGPAATLADDPIVAELYLGARHERRAAS